MKKFSLLLIILLCPIVLFGCTLGSSKIEDYMSELTKVYFKGTDVEHPNIRASISVGTRETPYKIDGIHQKTCDFSLISINFNEIFDEETIKASITINEESKEIELYYNPINSSYMNDLGYALNDTDTITLIYNDYNITFTNITKDFKVDYKKAIEVASEKLKAEIEPLWNNGNFMGECYLEILTLQEGNFDQLFWYFRVVTQDNQTYKIVISTADENETLTEIN